MDQQRDDNQMTFDEPSIREQLEICKRATDEPWRFNRVPYDDKHVNFMVAGIWSDAKEKFISLGIPNEDVDTAFAIAARTGYPAALRELLRLRGWLRYARNQKNGSADVLLAWTDDAIDCALRGDPAPGTEAGK